MLSHHLSALQIVIPLLAAPLCAIIQLQRIAWVLALLVGLVCAGNSIAILMQVESAGEIIYALGGWAAPWGIEYRIDSANAFVLLIISIIYLAGTIYARDGVKSEVPEENRSWFYTAWILCFTGLCGITISGDVFNVFVFLEISSLSSYILISFGTDRRCLTAALRYLIVGTIAATFYLIGIGLLYALTGTLNMADLAERLPELLNRRTTLVAFGFIVIGLGIKMALFPLHNWLPNAYTYAPNAVTAFLAGTATKAAVYVFARLMFTVFPVGYFTDATSAYAIILGIGILGALVASAIAIFQDNLKRLFAWSSIGQIGYMAIGLGLATTSGVAATFLHLFNHALMKTAIFMAIGGLCYVTGTTTTASLQNAGRRMPWTMAAILIGGLSLIGVPFTTGFVSKWYLVSAALEQQYWWLASLILIGSLVTAAYVWKIVELGYFRKDQSIPIERQEAPLSLLIPTWILVLANIYFGVNVQLTGSQAVRAASALLGLPS